VEREKARVMVTMAATVGSASAERHVRKYLSDKIIAKHLFKVAKPYADFSVGEEISIDEVLTNGKCYYARTGERLIPINKLGKPAVGRVGKNPEKVEDQTIARLDYEIKYCLQQQGVHHLEMNLGSFSANVSGAYKVTGVGSLGKRPKADFTLNDSANTIVHYGSLKAGPLPTDFQQYGGLAALTEFPAVKEFTAVLEQNIDRETGVGQTNVLAWKLDSTKASHAHLIEHSMFGSTTKEYGLDCAHAIYYGTARVENNTVVADKVTYNDHTFTANDYPTQIVVRYTEKARNLGFHQTRVFVAPQGPRKIKKFL
jgi:hypothetical protein